MYHKIPITNLPFFCLQLTVTGVCVMNHIFCLLKASANCQLMSPSGSYSLDKVFSECSIHSVEGL